MIITGNFKINTKEAEEEVVFNTLKEFLIDNFQEFEFEVSGKKETFRHIEKPTLDSKQEDDLLEEAREKNYEDKKLE